MTIRVAFTRVLKWYGKNQKVVFPNIELGELTAFEADHPAEFVIGTLL